MSLFRKPGIVNVRMVITDEKILSNIDKVQKLINPTSKKSIVQLEEDSYFKDLIDSIKTYLTEYPNKKTFPASVYKAAYGLVEYATGQFEENTKEVEGLIRQREKNINLSGELKKAYQSAKEKEENWKAVVGELEEKTSEEVIEALTEIGKSKTDKGENYKAAVKLIEARINNLTSNLHIEIDMERIEDRSKALSYIGIEIAEALKQIPTPVNYDVVEEKKEEIVENVQQDEYIQETVYDVKPGLWTRIKNSKFVKRISYMLKIKVVLQLPQALPEGRAEV